MVAFVIAVALVVSYSDYRALPELAEQRRLERTLQV